MTLRSTETQSTYWPSFPNQQFLNPIISILRTNNQSLPSEQKSQEAKRNFLVFFLDSHTKNEPGQKCWFQSIWWLLLGLWLLVGIKKKVKKTLLGLSYLVSHTYFNFWVYPSHLLMKNAASSKIRPGNNEIYKSPGFSLFLPV